ncbi:MAG: ABC transporter permease [Bacillota bacterium]
MQISRRLGKYTAVTRVAVTNRLAYWPELAARAGFFALILFIFSQLWGKLLGSHGSLLGFDRVQLVWYLTITEVLTLSRTSLVREVTQDVKSGQIAYLLLRPSQYVLYQFANYLGEIVVALLLNFLVGSAVATLLVGLPPLTPDGAAQALLLTGIALCLQFLVLIGIALLSFFVEESAPFQWIYSKMLFTLGGLFIPIDIYPEFFRKLAAALPFRSLAYGPARVFVAPDRQLFAELAGRGLIWIGLLALLVAWEYGKGVKRVNVNGG